jgi:hypothetical protein
MNNNFLIDNLIKNKFIEKVIGDIPIDLNLGFVVQARSLPKYPFKAFVELSRVLSKKSLCVFVDNLYSQTFLKRTDKEQEILDKEYQIFFKSLGCKIIFSKDIFFKKYSGHLLDSFLKIGKKISYCDFSQCLPEEKRNNILNLGVEEIFHTLIELLLFKYISNECNTLMIGYTSQAIINLYRNIESNEKLSAIITPKFSSNKDVGNYIKRINEFSPKPKIYNKRCGK